MFSSLLRMISSEREWPQQAVNPELLANTWWKYAELQPSLVDKRSTVLSRRTVSRVFPLQAFDRGCRMKWGPGTGTCLLVVLLDDCLSRQTGVQTSSPRGWPAARAGVLPLWTGCPCRVQANTEELFCTLPFIKSTLKWWWLWSLQSSLHPPAGAGQSALCPVTSQEVGIEARPGGTCSLSC